MGLLTDDLRSRIGVPTTYRAPDPIGAAGARYYAQAVGDANPAYRTVDARGTVLVPPTLIFETNQFTDRPMSPEGHAGHDWGLEVPGTRQVRGGNRYRFYRAVRSDDRISATYQIDSVEEKRNRAGHEMLVLSCRVDYRDDQGELVADNEENLILIALEAS